MKQDEFKPCINCGKGMAEENVFFYRVKVEQYVLNTNNIREQIGLEMMMGDAAPLAAVLGPNKNLAERMGEFTVLVCGQCGVTERRTISSWLEEGNADG